MNPMCNHPNCPIKTKCGRHGASGTKNVPFQRFEVFPFEKGKCTGRLPVKKP